MGSSNLPHILDNLLSPVVLPFTFSKCLFNVHSNSYSLLILVSTLFLSCPFVLSSLLIPAFLASTSLSFLSSPIFFVINCALFSSNISNFSSVVASRLCSVTYIPVSTWPVKALPISVLESP